MADHDDLLTLEEFLGEYGGLTDLTEIAEVALGVVDDELQEAARNYLDALEAFEEMLDRIGYERG